MPIDLPSLTKIKNAIFGRDDDVQQQACLEGRTVAGRFTIVRRIGAGGMGSVYLARQTSMDRDVAIKFLNSDKNRDDDARARFRLEAAAVSRLRNPHTITVFDFGEDDDGELFLVMELLDGRPLIDIFRESGPMAAATVVAIADQILDSLAEAHAAGVLHRDLKPENVFVKETEDHGLFVKVLDFGIARIIGSPAATRTWPGVIFGTPAYMSPEQVMGKPGDQRSDLYSLGVVMFELLTGALPISGKTPIEIGVKKVRVRPPALEDINPERGYPAGSSDFLRKVLSPNVADRPLTAREFRKAMHQAFGTVTHGTSEVAAAPRRKTAPKTNQVVVSVDGSSSTAWKYDGDRDDSTGSLGTTIKQRVKPAQANRPERSTPPVKSKPELLQDSPLADFDRRRARRMAKLVSAKCYYDGDSFPATSSDLSGTGGFLSSSVLPVIGHRITLTFACPGTRDYNISLLAEVVRISPGSGSSGEIRGFAVRWLKMKARGDLACVTHFLKSTIGVEFSTSLPDTASAPQWEYLFEESKFV